VIDAARAKYANLLVLAINASPEVLRARLQKRGRETPAEIEERLQRAAAFRLVGADVVTLNNDGPLADGVAAFVALLEKRD
jgi:ribose 1,5-bisphosphokinase